MSLTLFLAILFIITYIYFLYPLLLLLVSTFSSNHKKDKLINSPEISILFVVNNEGIRVKKKIKNLLSSNYPKEKIRIFVASDGSTDETNAILKNYKGENISYFLFDDQKGKAARLNFLMSQINTKLAVLCDVRQQFHPDALLELIRNFSDPKIGAVSGELVLRDNSNSVVHLSLYWKYEKFLRKKESKIDSTCGVTGAIYALRTRLFQPIPEDTILDDVLIPMQIVKQGYHVKFDSAAIAYDSVQAEGHKEYKRKVRTLAGNFQLIFKHPWLLNPFKNRIFVQYFSHKVLRLLVPFLFLGLLLSNLFLLDNPIFQFTFAAQIIFHIIGLVCLAMQKRPIIFHNKFLRTFHTFYFLNVAVMEGLIQYLFKKDLVKWK